MEIPKDYIKCINFDIRTIDFSDNYSDRLENLLKDYITPYISTGNYRIGFTLIKPLDKDTLNILSNFKGIDYFEEIEYIPYNKDEDINKLIDNNFSGNYHTINYLKYLMQFIPDKPILEKLIKVKFTLNIPNEILEADRVLNQLNIKKYFNDTSSNYFTHKFFEETVMVDYGVGDVYETEINNNEITLYYIQLPCYCRDKISIDEVVNENSEYIRSIEVIGIEIPKYFKKRRTFNKL